MNQPTPKPTASALVQHVPVPALAFRVLVHVQVEEAAK